MPYPFSLIEVFNDSTQNLKGNTSTVVWLEASLNDEAMQAIAADFNQPATTFLWPAEDASAFHVRWFAPDAEIGLCGHGSLAAVAFLAEEKNVTEEVTLLFRDGKLSGKKTDDESCNIRLDAIPVIGEEAVSEVLKAGLGVKVKAHFRTNNKNIVLLEDEATLKNMRPDFAKLRESEIFGYAVTAPGDQVDFVSRTIVPHVQQLEDHATGSSHAALTPFWAERLNKNQMQALQLSRRGGRFVCSLEGDQVTLEGKFSVLARGVWQ
jgi:predicted PhzF superfamily epimerase YddE/YHI9